MIGTEAILETSPKRPRRQTSNAPRASVARVSVLLDAYSAYLVAVILSLSLATGIAEPAGAQELDKSITNASADAVTSSANHPAGNHLSNAFERADPTRIRASGETVHRWTINGAQASYLVGDCDLYHGDQHYGADSILIVSDGPRGRVRNRIVFEGLRKSSQGNARPDDAEPTPRQVVWRSNVYPLVQAPNRKGQPKQRPFLMEFLPDVAIEAIGSAQSDVSVDRSRFGEVQQAQFTEQVPMQGQLPSVPTLASPELPSPELAAPTSGLPLATNSAPPKIFDDGATTGGQPFIFGDKSVVIDSRNASMAFSLQTVDRPEVNETAWIARGGVTAEIRDVSVRMENGQLIKFDSVNLSADRIVFWTPMVRSLFQGDADISSSAGEMYLEGDVVFRAGENVIYAQSMFYNVTRETGLVLDAEAITTIDEFQGVVRVKAEVMQQVAKGNYRAFDAAVTSSRMGVPRYWLQSDQLQLNERTRNVVDQSTGRLRADRDYFVTSDQNFVFLGGIPLLYWPRFATSLEKPTFYLSDVDVNNDNIFGTQVLLDWDLFQLLGIEDAPPGVDWELSTDYLSDRGPALGTNLNYTLPGLFGIPGLTRGDLDVWGISDSGTDQLGLDRLALEPEEDFRGRALLRHQQEMPNGYRFVAELGWLSDRNFLEQYLESEWDQDLDHTTGIRLQRHYFNQLFDLSANLQLNDFYQETERLPALDHYLLGGTFLGERVTWQMHNHASYSKLNRATDPVNAAEAAEYFPLPGEDNRDGVVVSTNQQLSITLPVGPINVRPTASVEASHFGEASDGDSLTRIVGQAGIAMNLPMVRIDSSIENSLLNIRGLAHKMDWTAEYWYADSDANLNELPLYDSLDDNAQEQFRRRFIGDTFGGALPSRFDPRTYAFRQGIQRNVTSPSDVIADDLQQFRLGLHQRVQTKRGLPGRDRIVDLIQFDIDTILFPNADRDNFGETIGPTTYDFRYHIGDRFSILSDGYIDFFDDGLRSISAGLKTSRPGVGDWYIGLMSLEGPISSTVLRTAMDYRLNEKWIFSGATTYDFGTIGNVGQSVGLTRIGESLLVRLNIDVNPGRDNVGFGFQVEPRFFTRRLGRIGGGLIPPPGIAGVE